MVIDSGSFNIFEQFRSGKFERYIPFGQRIPMFCFSGNNVFHAGAVSKIRLPPILSTNSLSF